jgi:hypothetical protein
MVNPLRQSDLAETRRDVLLLTREEALTLLQTATRDLHNAMTRVRFAVGLDEEELSRLKDVLKDGARVKGCSPGSVMAVVDRLRGETTELMARISDVIAPAPLTNTPVSQGSSAVGDNNGSQRPQAAATIPLWKRLQVVALMQQGMSPSQALRESGCNASRWTARRWLRDVESQNDHALADRRKTWKRRKTVLLEPAIEVVLSIWATHPGAKVKPLMRKIEAACTERGLKPPSYSAVKKLIASQPEAMKAIRRGDKSSWMRQHRPIVSSGVIGRYANERWQMDHTTPDVWVKLETPEGWVVQRAYLTAGIDEFTRTITGFIVSLKSPDRWTVQLLLLNSIRAKKNPAWLNHGVPEVVCTDHGMDFLAESVENTLAKFKTRVDRARKKTPDDKPEIERWFGTLNTGCLQLLSSSTKLMSQAEAERKLDQVLTREELQAEIERFIVDVYHQRPHEGLKNRKPLDLWEQTRGHVRSLTDERLRDFLLLDDRHRIVRRGAVEFTVNGIGGTYKAPAFLDHEGRGVRVGYNPEEMQSISCTPVEPGYDPIEAWLLDAPDCPFNGDEWARIGSDYVRTVQERLIDYADRNRERDRVSTRGQHAARASAKRMTERAVEANVAADAATLEEELRRKTLRDKFKNQDRAR